MISFVIYNATTGELLSTASVEGMTEAQIMSLWPREVNQEILFCPERPANQFDYRVNNGELVSKDLMTPAVNKTAIQADGSDELVITGLPTPCQIVISGAVSVPTTEVIGGEVIITATTPGSITIQAFSDPVFKPWEITISAV